MIGWMLFALYYATGWCICLFVYDRHGREIRPWHVPLVALVWPALFVDWG